MELDFITSEWIKKYCDMEIESETERWNELSRPKNDPYINGSHSGHTRALYHLKKTMEMLERLEEKRMSREQVDCIKNQTRFDGLLEESEEI